MRRVHVQTVSFANIAITIALGIACAILFWQGRAQFEALQQATEAYISCESDAQQMQDRSDYLTEQVRLVTMTAKPEYIDSYFSMANSNEEFDEAFADLKSRFEGTDAYESLRTAMDESNELMNTEFYAMRLICEANGIDPSPWPEIASCQISDEDSRTSHDSMIYEAQNLVSDSKYQEAKDSINSHTSDCIAKVTDATIGSQNRAASVFDGIYGTIEACVAIYIALTLVICALVRRAIVKPLLSFGDSIKANQLFPVQGAGELQVLAETYNRVFTENEATHMVVKHQAEHDPLASCYLVTFDEGYADKVEAAIEGHMKVSTRAEITTASLADQGLVVICDSMEQAIQSVNVIAPEHLELHFDGAFEQLGAIRNAGAIFVGEWTPEAVGDYVAGPNHTLPTGGTARYASPLSTDEFVKHSSVIQYSAKSLANDADAVIAIARHEGLWAHARSVELRKALVETGDIYGLDGADE